MKLICTVTGIPLIFKEFESLNFSFPAHDFIHPIITQLIEGRRILRIQPIQFQPAKLRERSDKELLLMTGSLLKINPLIHIHKPIAPPRELIEEGLSRLFGLTAHCLRERATIDLPSFSINEGTRDLSSLLTGWLDEIEADRANERRRYKEESLSRLEEKFQKLLRRRLMAGKTFFGQLIDRATLEWLFDMANVPKNKWDDYKEVLYADSWDRLLIPNAGEKLIELNQLICNWYSLGNHKKILLRHITHSIVQFRELGGLLPAWYYTELENEDSEIGKLEASRQIKKSIQFEIVQAARQIPGTKPKRENYSTLQEYAKALVEYNRGRKF